MNSKDLSKSVIFQKGEKAPNTIFTGSVWVEMLVTDREYNCSVYNVTFEPSGRAFWHSHPGGQILLVIGGEGYYQQDGRPARPLSPGDVVTIPPNVKHWHGARKSSWFVHVGMSTNPQKGDAKWLGEVSDEEYDNLRVEK